MSGSYYDAALARFVTADTVIDGEYSVSGWNRYMYCAGNPVLYKDPSEHYAIGQMLQNLFYYSKNEPIVIIGTAIGSEKEGQRTRARYYLNEVGIKSFEDLEKVGGYAKYCGGPLPVTMGFGSSIENFGHLGKVVLGYNKYRYTGKKDDLNKANGDAVRETTAFAIGSLVSIKIPIAKDFSSISNKKFNQIARNFAESSKGRLPQYAKDAATSVLNNISSGVKYVNDLWGAVVSD
ncbi:MAG: hypothetical protein JXK07_08575 [Spirochaetes bacterium]|nr:hypothetical protein [Spirochaetota bacterium]MBN2770967.1 hypothetical protein [Spirochaetota bacterium]